VQLFNGSQLLDTLPLSSGSAVFALPTASVAAFTLHAVYVGDDSFLSATSNEVTHQINRAATTSTLTISPTGSSKSGQNVVLTASVTGDAAAGVPSGLITFYDDINGKVVLGTASLSQLAVATLTVSDLSVASHFLSFVYSGDASFQSSDSTSTGAIKHDVDAAVTTIAFTSDPAVQSVYGQTVQLAATVSVQAPAVGVPSGFVSFVYASSGLPVAAGAVRPLINGVATLSVNGLAVSDPSGVTFLAKYSGDDRSRSSEQDLSHVVNKAVVVLNNVVATPNPSTYGQEVTIQGELSVVAPGAGIITGSVDLLWDGELLQSADVVQVNGVYTITFAVSAPVKGIPTLRYKIADYLVAPDGSLPINLLTITQGNVLPVLRCFILGSFGAHYDCCIAISQRLLSLPSQVSPPRRGTVSQ